MDDLEEQLRLIEISEKSIREELKLHKLEGISLRQEDSEIFHQELNILKEIANAKIKDDLEEQLRLIRISEKNIRKELKLHDLKRTSLMEEDHKIFLQKADILKEIDNIKMREIDDNAELSKEHHNTELNPDSVEDHYNHIYIICSNLSWGDIESILELGDECEMYFSYEDMSFMTQDRSLFDSFIQGVELLNIPYLKAYKVIDGFYR